jgi:hypothetical protein
MDLGDIVTTACLLCTRHWRTMIPMSFVTMAATLMTDVGLIPVVLRMPSTATAATIALPSIPLAFAPLLGLGILGLLFNQLALIRFSLEAWLNADTNVKHLYQSAASRFLSAAASAAITGAAFLIGTATWIGIPVALYFLVCWFFAGQVCVGEGELNPLRALGRSRSIVRGGWWRTAAILAGLTLLGLLPSIIVGWLRTGSIGPALALSALATAVAAPFFAASQTMLYIDLRIRKHESIALTASKPAESV